jgi:bifunctional aspartokinase / homoserine dehydrogenase 1
MKKLVDNVSFGWPAGRGKLRIAVIGATGRVGARVVELVETRAREWSAIGLRPRIVFAANSRASLADADGLDASSLAAKLRDGAAWPDFGDLDVDVVLDCTASLSVAARYPEWLAHGIHVVTPNKIASSADYALQTAILGAQARTGARLRDSTTVGAQLPLLATLTELRRAGDRIERLEAVLSGTLSYVLGSVQAGSSLSQSIGEAVALGYAEPDPACDLSGTDAARKLVILLRSAGIDIELSDVERIPLLEVGDDPWVKAALAVDETWRARAALAQARHEKWIYRASYEHGRARIAPERVTLDHPLARLAPCENAIVLHSDLYRAAPLTIAGPGAGIALTAAGVFADLVAIAETHIPTQAAVSRPLADTGAVLLLR